MERFTFKRFLAYCLIAAIILSCVPATAGAAGAARDGQFALAVVTQERVVIEPVYLSYNAGDTVRTALKNSGHSFEGIDSGFISAIDGVTDNYCLFYDGEGYDLDVSADQVTAVCFTSAQEQYSERYLALLIVMAEYDGSTNGVKNYPAAQEAYRNALSKLYGATAEEAETLRTELQKAMDAYAAYLNGETVTLRLSVTQGSETNKAVNAVFTGGFGNTYQVTQATEIALIPGRYTFDLSDGGINHVRGTVTVAEGQTLSASLPSGTWIANVELSTDSGEQWAAARRDGNIYYVPDCAAGNIYPYIEPGEGVDTTACGVYLADTPNAARRTWQSKQAVLSALIPQNSMEGAAFALEARLADGAFEQYQRYPMEIVRVPTLASLTVSGDGTQLPLSFTPSVTEYQVTTVSDTLQIDASPLCADAAVSINGIPGKTAAVPISGSGYQIAVEVSHTNGQKTVYTLSVTKVAPAQVTVTHAQEVAVSVQNAAGVPVAPKAHNGTATVFALIPGENYTYVATKDIYYHTSAAFTAKEALTVNAPTPDATNWLSALHVGPTKTVAYGSDTDFQPATHTYTYRVGSNQTAFGILVTLADTAQGCTITGYYADYRYWNPAYGARTLTLSDGVYKSTTTFLGASGEGNTMRLEIGKSQNGVTYYQEYFLTAQRLLQLNSLSFSANGQSLPMAQENGTQKFDKEVLHYTLSVGQTLDAVTAEVKLFNTSGGNDNAFTLTLTCGDSTQTLDYTALAVDAVQSITLPLNPARTEEQISIRLAREGAISQTYTITVRKLPPVETEIVVTPRNAVVFLTDDLTGARIWPEENGKYSLNTDAAYTYTATCYGYAAATASFTAGQEQKVIAVTLQKAEENTRSELLQSSDWASFRGNPENNGVTAAPTPITAEAAALNWANQIGEGLTGGGVGSPIIVGGVIYTYANDTVMKVDKTTGEVLLAKPMDHASSFSITPPAYGEGMIFIGLSNGAVQAFDAETLESLWLYEDALGGQPNCPITYRDGYLYTGFWNSETRQANFVCISVTDEDTAQSKERKVASWTYSGAGFYWAGSYVSENFLLVTTDDGDSGYTKGHGEILSLDPRTGRLIDCQTASGVGDLRSSVCYDEATDAYYFTSKGGDFYRIEVDADGTFREGSQKRLHLSNGSDNASTPPMSTSTPVVYNGRAYIGVSGTSQFGAYSGHNITVIDLQAWRVAYSVPTQGYPQTSGLLTTAYEAETSYVYVYFIDNYTPGKLRVLRDQAGQTAADPAYLTTEVYTSVGQESSVQTAYVLFTPYSAQAQYAICSPIADSDGNLYFKNDSGYMMCVGSTITELSVESAPEKTVYEVGQCFDPDGLRVTAHYANGVEKDVTQYIRFSQEPLTAEDTEFTLTYSLGAYQQMYQNRDGESGAAYYVPTATVDLTVFTEHLWDAGAVTREPTCAADGETTYTCTLCGAIKTEPISSTQTHTWDAGAVTREPTCAADGKTTYTCTICGAIKTEPIPSTQTHTWDEGTVTKAPTATQAGEKTYTCVLCGATKTEPLPASGSCDGGVQCPSRNLRDVPLNAWYHNEVDYAITNGLMFGTSGTTFEPEAPMTRAQLVTVLWRQAGCPAPSGSNPFRDLTASWYLDAVVWAAENGVVNGVGNGQFDPDGVLTREQLATILCRYTKDYLHLDTSAREDFSAFEDGQRVASWAREAMQWAVAEGLIGGSKEGGKLYLNPQAGATRAQVAAILMRFVENVAK
ncbi:MAG: S-layer homology domain-containing protein [Faecousia sp.]